MFEKTRLGLKQQYPQLLESLDFDQNSGSGKNYWVRIWKQQCLEGRVLNTHKIPLDNFEKLFRFHKTKLEILRRAEAKHKNDSFEASELINAI